MKMVPTCFVEVIVKNENGILLGKRNTTPFKGMWQLTGGIIYFNEPIAHTVKRVAKREIGVHVKIVKFLGAYEYIKKDPRGHLIGLAYLVTITSGTIASNPDNSELTYFKKIPKNMVSFHKKIFRDALKAVC